MTTDTPTIQLPSYYADTAHVVRQEFTVHVLIGHMDLQANVVPTLHVTMGPAFCRALARQLLEAAGD